MVPAAAIPSPNAHAGGEGHGCGRMKNLAAELGLPTEISTTEAAEILGVDKHTVIKYLEAGWLEYRDVSTPGSSKPTYRLKLEAILKMRTTYRTGSPSAGVIAPRRRRGRRTQAQSVKLSRHLVLSGGWQA